MVIYKHGRGFELGTTENKSSWRSGRDLNFGPPNCKSSAPTARTCCLLNTSSYFFFFSPLYPPLYLFTGVRPIQINRLSIRKYTCFVCLSSATLLYERDGHPFIRSGWRQLPKLCSTCRTVPSVSNYI